MSRNAYAIEQLTSEVRAAYPDIEVEYGEPDGLDVVRSVSYSPVPQQVEQFLNLLPEPRVASTSYDENSETLVVTVQGQSTLADDRAPFNLAEGLGVLLGSDDEADDEQPEKPKTKRPAKKTSAAKDSN